MAVVADQPNATSTLVLRHNSKVYELEEATAELLAGAG